MQFDIVHITSLFENATEGFVVTDGHGKIILVNPSTCKMFGYEAERLVGRTIEMLVPVHYRQEHVLQRDNFYKNPHNRVMGHGRDLHGQKSNGDNFPVEVSLSTYIRDGERYVIAFIVDITERKKIEQSMVVQQMELERMTTAMRQLNLELEAKVEERTIILREALQRLEQSQQELNEALDKEKELNEIKSRFVSMASHEFRTPLSTVLSSASLLGKYIQAEDQDKRNRHIEKIKASVKHLNDLLEDFLSLGRLDENKVSAAFHPFRLDELVRDTIEDLQGLIKKGQQIQYAHQGSVVVDSDDRLVKNILINLISNAIKFSDSDSIISVDSEITSEQVLISVKDQGIGIAEVDQEHLFSSFFRGQNALNIQGTGLGLHIVKQYLRLLGGSIRVESRLGKGTTVTFTLPINHS